MATINNKIKYQYNQDENNYKLSIQDIDIILDLPFFLVQNYLSVIGLDRFVFVSVTKVCLLTVPETVWYL